MSDAPALPPEVVLSIPAQKARPLPGAEGHHLLVGQLNLPGGSVVAEGLLPKIGDFLLAAGYNHVPGSRGHFRLGRNLQED